jgi:hypothetical protein
VLFLTIEAEHPAAILDVPDVMLLPFVLKFTTFKRSQRKYQRLAFI